MSEADRRLPTRMTREAYRAWALAQPKGRFELIGGEVVGMAPERVGHALVKAAVWAALRDAIRAAGVPCQALPDGATVEIDDKTDYEPDAVVHCGERLDRNAVAVAHPVIVVEVASPSTSRDDKGTKLDGYFRVPSIQHYLLVRFDQRVVIHHRRRPDGDGIDTRIVGDGVLLLDPPGIAVDVGRFYDE